MSTRRFRFLHASDLHLEAPVCGVDEVPDHLHDLFLDAPFRAAERLFEAAIAERVDFVLLAGDVANLKTGGCRALEFLEQGFRALQDESIAVYWSESRNDHLDRWPAAVPFPENVHLFRAAHVESLTVGKRKRPIARILGSRASDSGSIDLAGFEGDASLFSIALAHGFPSAESQAQFEQSSIDYWALGGLHNARDISSPSSLVRYAGTPQGRHIDEAGPPWYFAGRR